MEVQGGIEVIGLRVREELQADDLQAVLQEHQRQNVLMCIYRDHDKPSKDTLAMLMQQLIPGFIREHKDVMALSCVGQLYPSSLVSQTSKTHRSIDLKEKICENTVQTYFDTVTGESKAVTSEKKYWNRKNMLCTSCKH